jgi:hypothetical protein
MPARKIENGTPVPAGVQLSSDFWQFGGGFAAPDR